MSTPKHRYLEGLDEVPWYVWPLGVIAALAVVVTLVLLEHGSHSSTPAAAPTAGLTAMMSDLRSGGEAHAFAITGVHLDGSTLVVETSLYPKSENSGPAMGACTTTWVLVGPSGGYGVDASSVMVYGQGRLAAEWFKGDQICTIASSFR